MRTLDPIEEARRNPDRYLSGYPDMLLDDETALVTKADYDRITNYAGGYHTSYPSGVVPGKIWYRCEQYSMSGGRKRMVHGGGDPTLTRHLMGSYEEHPKTPETHVLTRFRELVIA